MAIAGPKACDGSLRYIAEADAAPSTIPRLPSPFQTHLAHRKTKRAADRSAAPLVLERMTYFRLVIAVRSAENFTTPAALHQLEPKPAGLMGVMKAGLKLLVE